MIYGIGASIPSGAILFLFFPWLPRHPNSNDETLEAIGCSVFLIAIYFFAVRNGTEKALREATLGEREFFKIFTLFSIPFILYASIIPFIVVYRFGDKENIYSNYFISILIFLISLFSGIAAIKHQWRLASAPSRPKKDSWMNWKPLSFNSAPRRSLRRSRQNIEIRMTENTKEKHDKENLIKQKKRPLSIRRIKQCGKNA